MYLYCQIHSPFAARDLRLFRVPLGLEVIIVIFTKNKFSLPRQRQPEDNNQH
jgi:hypothetical protein